ncbi:MAG: efflux RND transporter periplasmic adaptor subunit [Chloroflexota bacterium]
MKKLLNFLLFTFLLAACGPAQTTALQASGLIEATEIAVAPELSGRVVEVLVAEGDSVEAGNPLLVLDDSLLQAEKRTLEAALDSANANVDAAQAAFDLAQLQYAQTLEAAIAAEQPTRLSTWNQTKPSDFDQPTWYFDKSERCEATQAEVEAAAKALDEARVKLESIEKQVSSAAFTQAEADLAQARVAYDIAKSVLDSASSASDNQKLRDEAQSRFDDAKLDLEDAQKAYDDALTTEGATDVLEARARLAVTQERLDAAKDALRLFQTGAQSPEALLAQKAVEQAGTMLEAARTSVNEVQAHLSLIETQVEKLTVRASQDGVVLSRSVQPGEVIQAGMTAMTIAKLDKLTVTVYLSEDRYGEVKLGEYVTLSVDSFPGETFTATVTRIADQAEYTPRNVQTKEERQTTVYAIELTVDNADGRLKPGMPVDVAFAP